MMMCNRARITSFGCSFFIPGRDRNSLNYNFSGFPASLFTIGFGAPGQPVLMDIILIWVLVSGSMLDFRVNVYRSLVLAICASAIVVLLKYLTLAPIRRADVDACPEYVSW